MIVGTLKAVYVFAKIGIFFQIVPQKDEFFVNACFIRSFFVPLRQIWKIIAYGRIC